LHRFLRNLFGFVGTTRTAQPIRHTGRRANLRLEHLEDRMVPTTVTSGGSTLLVDCTPNRVIRFEQAPGQIVISDNVQGVVGRVNRSAFQTIVIAAQGQDVVDIDDSNGMPFLLGQTINLNGGGTNNVVDLFGSRSIDTGASYSVGGTTSTATTLVEDNLTFHLAGNITQVIDTLQDTGGPLTVSTGGNGVILSGSSGEQTLSNLGLGGGGTFTFAHKSQVVLNENAAFTRVFLEAREAATSEQSFTLHMNAQDDSTSVFATPSDFVTNVQAAGNDETVNVEAASGNLNIGGGNTTDVNLAGAGIQAFVKVNDVADLIVTNTGTTAQNVTVTTAAVFGTGLFGNNSAEVSYQDVTLLAIKAGAGADHYTVNALSGPFTSKLEIEDTSSTKSFVDDVFVNSGSRLNLTLVNLANPDVGELTVNHQGGTVSVSRVSSTSTNGVVTVSYPGELPSVVTYDGFASVDAASS
jgi:hypothetical protein